nr:immunoglobulin heavy chain junction region [Mus musculus]
CARFGYYYYVMDYW